MQFPRLPISVLQDDYVVGLSAPGTPSSGSNVLGSPTPRPTPVSERSGSSTTPWSAGNTAISDSEELVSSPAPTVLSTCCRFFSGSLITNPPREELVKQIIRLTGSATPRRRRARHLRFA